MEKTAGERLADYIKEHFASTADFCRAAKLKESMVCRIKSGARGKRMSPEIAKRIAKATNGKFPPSVWVQS